MSEQVACCPECESTQIYRRTGEDSRYASAADETTGYRCRECQTVFETPDKREAKSGGGYYLNGEAMRLDQMDPEDVPAFQD